MLWTVYEPLLGSFCVVCSLHCFSSSVVCRLVLFHFGVFPLCLHFLVHSVVAKLVVSKNCPKLVHKYLQNYSKTQYHWNWNCVKKLPEIILVTNHNHIEVEGNSWKKIEIKVWGKINFYIDPGFTGFSYFYSMIQDDPNAANIRKQTRTTKI